MKNNTLLPIQLDSLSFANYFLNLIESHNPIWPAKEGKDGRFLPESQVEFQQNMLPLINYWLTNLILLLHAIEYSCVNKNSLESVSGLQHRGIRYWIVHKWCHALKVGLNNYAKTEHRLYNIKVWQGGNERSKYVTSF